jgi:hypothetical protein
MRPASRRQQSIHTGVAPWCVVLAPQFNCPVFFAKGIGCQLGGVRQTVSHCQDGIQGPKHLRPQLDHRFSLTFGVFAIVSTSFVVFIIAFIVRLESWSGASGVSHRLECLECLEPLPCSSWSGASGVTVVFIV